MFFMRILGKIAILTYFAVNNITSVMLAAIMIDILAVVCLAAAFAHEVSDGNLTAAAGDDKRDAWECTNFDSWEWEKLRTLGLLGSFRDKEKPAHLYENR